MANNATILVKERKDELDAKLEQINQAIKDRRPMSDVSKLEDELSNCEKLYLAAKRTELYESMNATENPIKTALLTRKFKTYKHKPVKQEDGTLVKYVFNEVAKEFDLLDFCEKSGLNTEWDEKIQELNCLFAAKLSGELDTAKKQQEVIDDFLMSENARNFARELLSGKVKISNTHIKNVLQEAIDGILFEGDGDENAIKSLAADLRYLEVTYAKRSKKIKFGIECSKTGDMRTKVCDIIERILTNGVWTIDYKPAKKESNS